MAGEIYRGQSAISNIYRGNVEVNNVYRGQTQIWPSGVAPFNFTFDKKVTNIGSAGSLDPNVGSSLIRNSAITFNSTTGTFWLHASGGGTSTYHFEYNYAGSGTNTFRGITNPDRSNRGIAWNGTYYVETIFATTPGNSKFNPTRLGTYEYDSANVEMDLVGSEASGPSDDLRQIAYSPKKNQYYVADPNNSVIRVLDASFSQVTTINTSAIGNEVGVAISDTFDKIFVVNRNADGAGNNYIKVYNLDTYTEETPLTILGSDMGSYFRLGGMAVDDVNRRLVILHNNSPSGATQNASEGWFWTF